MSNPAIQITDLYIPASKYSIQGNRHIRMGRAAPFVAVASGVSKSMVTPRSAASRSANDLPASAMRAHRLLSLPAPQAASHSSRTLCGAFIRDLGVGRIGAPDGSLDRAVERRAVTREDRAE